MVAAPEEQRGHARKLSLQHASNSLVLANLPEQLYEPQLNNLLRQHFEPGVQLWAPLQGFGRIMVVYSSVLEAARVKQALDRSFIEDADGNPVGSPEHIPTTLLRVYFGPSTPESMLARTKQNSLANSSRLPVPVTDKNFLISPPGSPPVGWEQIREDPPNTLTLADDLMAALSGLAMQDDNSSKEGGTSVSPIESPSDSLPESSTRKDTDDTPPKKRSHSRSDTLIISSPADASFPSVLVSDMDADAEQDVSSNGITIANTPRGVARPGSISQVRATAESMQGSPNAAAKITPTARPPVYD